VKAQELEEQIKSNEALMVYFSGIDCGVCEVLKPKVKEMMEQNFPKIKQVFVNAHENQECAANFNVFTIPTVLVFLDGKEFIRKSRNLSIPAFKEELQRPYDLFFN
jgi:thioredoxin-like negative regulator of GroEL